VTAFLPIHEIGEAVDLIKEEMRELFPGGVEVVEWFHRYYVGTAAIFPSHDQ
jgi:hypothetical protein